MDTTSLKPSTKKIVNNKTRNNLFYIRHKQLKKITGLTLIEVLIVLALSIILATIVFPHFKSIMQYNRISTQTNLFLSYVQLAKSKAVNKGWPITVCSGLNGHCVSNNSWSSQWIAFVDKNGNGVIDSNDHVFKIKNKHMKQITISSNVNKITFNSNGFLKTNNSPYLDVRANHCIDSNNIKITINKMGMTKTKNMAC